MTAQQRFDRTGITGSDDQANNVNKNFFIDFLPFANAEENISGITHIATTSTSILDIGGGDAAKNAVTQISFYVAANNTTLDGSETLTIDGVLDELTFFKDAHILDDVEVEFGTATNGDYAIYYDSSELSLIYEGKDATNKRQVFLIGNTGDQAFIWTSDLLDNSTKGIRISGGHYDYQTEEPVSILNMTNSVAANELAIGGNTASHNTITRGDLVAAANNTTTTGTIVLRWTSARVEILGDIPFKVNPMTTTERNLITAENGDIIYNETDNKFQGYEAGAWTNLI